MNCSLYTYFRWLSRSWISLQTIVINHGLAISWYMLLGCWLISYPKVNIKLGFHEINSKVPSRTLNRKPSKFRQNPRGLCCFFYLNCIGRSTFSSPSCYAFLFSSIGDLEGDLGFDPSYSFLRPHLPGLRPQQAISSCLLCFPLQWQEELGP
jgi:hypothetical protein